MKKGSRPEPVYIRKAEWKTVSARSETEKMCDVGTTNPAFHEI